MSHLGDVLETQALNEYDKLADKYASGKVKALWREATYFHGPRAGRNPIWLGLVPDWAGIFEEVEQR